MWCVELPSASSPGNLATIIYVCVCVCCLYNECVCYNMRMHTFFSKLCVFVCIFVHVHFTCALVWEGGQLWVWCGQLDLSQHSWGTM